MKKAREAEARKRQSRNRLLTLAIAVATIAIALIITYFLFFSGPGGSGRSWHLDSAGLLRFDARPAITATSTPVEATQNWTLEKISYRSFGTDVYALLRTPANVSRPPVVIVLPAASINKEADAEMAKALATWGYATLTLDERGNNGETAGPSAQDVSSGYDAFAGGGDPVQYEQIYDVLRGYDYIRSRADLDGGNVSVLGESVGTWYAIVSAAEEPGIKAVFEVSAVPYSWHGYDTASRQFYRSIEPGVYLSRLPPRKIVFFHFTDDPIVPIAYGRVLYDAASEPKAWHEYNGTIHGLYSDVYAPDLHAELKGVFGR